MEEQTQSSTNQTGDNPPEEKKERVDELDLIGIGIIRLLQKGMDKVKNLLGLRKNT